MVQITNQTIYELIDQIAPFETQEEFDNAGFLVGKRGAPVRRVLLTLDVTPAVIREAMAREAQLIVSHHPVMFRGAKRLLSEEFEGDVIMQLVRADIALISAHTNLDQSALGAGVLLSDRMRLKNRVQVDPYVVLGELRKPTRADALGRSIAKALGGGVRTFGRADTLVRRLAIAGGAYDEGYLAARAQGADAYLTGEVKHHNALAAAESGFVMYDGGHYHTEAPMMAALCECLQSKLDALQCDVGVFVAEAPALSAGYFLEEEA